MWVVDGFDHKCSRRIKTVMTKDRTAKNWKQFSSWQAYLLIFKNVYLKNFYSWAPVAHTWKPSYSGGRHQKDNSTKPAWTICL
jgi:hypothetical protein